MAAAAGLGRGQQAYARQEWGKAYQLLAAADRVTPLAAEDLERLAMSAYLTGRYGEHATILERAHHARMSGGEVERAAHCAFWLGFGLVSNGEFARGSGWLARAQRVLDDAASDCSVRGFLLVLAAAQLRESGDHDAAYARLGEAAEVAERFADQDLTMLVRLAMGSTLNRMGDTVAGVALLDEVMVAVTADEVSPIMVGTAYCAVIEECYQIFDQRRAQEWTAALSRWCSSHPDLVPYRGQCLVRRAEIMQLHGSWTDAQPAGALGRVRFAHSRTATLVAAESA
jgi:tetratricopeptide (TPR) repeat protein